jgi:phosphoglucosamine mutase
MRCFTPYPQLLQNVRYTQGGTDPLTHPDVISAIAQAEAELQGNGGRLLIRKSGTEPLIRIMAEGTDESQIQRIVGGLVEEARRVAHG